MQEKTILLIDKPKGITSFDVIRQLRKKLGIKKMGHAGTLDPLATGLMIVGINEGTKKLEEYLKLPKTYVADVLLGIQTTTGDMEGDIVVQVSKEDVTRKIASVELATLLENFIGIHTLPVPKYSAIKVGGKALYKYAREGKEPPQIPEKEMEVRDVKLLAQKDHEQGVILELEIDVSSGTYIRSLAEELGRRIDVPATLADLRRTRIGEFVIQDAQTLENF